MGTKIGFGFANTVQTNRNVSEYTKFYSCHPPGDTSAPASKDLFLSNDSEKNIQKIRKTRDRKRLPYRYCRKVPL